MFSQVKFHINYITKHLDLSICKYLYRYTKLFTLNLIKAIKKYLHKDLTRKKMTKYENTCKPKFQGFFFIMVSVARKDSNFEHLAQTRD